MKNTTSTVNESDGSRKNPLPPKPTYFVGSWLREFLLSNHQLVGKTFMMKNLCICIDMVYDLDDRHDGSAVYRMTDTDLAIRAIFTSASILNANDSSGSESEDFSATKLARSPIILEECRLIHLTIPGTMHGDFVLEVHSFTWEASKKISRHEVEEFLYLDQYIWCSEDPELQVVLKKVFEKRGGGILSSYSVTNCIDLLLEELNHNQTTKNMLFIPPEIAERFGLNDPGSYNGGTVALNGKETVNSGGQKKRKMMSDEEVNISCKIPCPSSDTPTNTISSVPLPANTEPSSAATTPNGIQVEKPSPDTCLPATKESIIPKTILAADPLCSSVQMQPRVHLKRLYESEISSYCTFNKTPLSRSGFFLDSIRSKKTLPKWVPKTLKKSPKFHLARNKNKRFHEPVGYFSPLDTDLIGPQLKRFALDPVLQTVPTESQISLPISESLEVLLSEEDSSSVCDGDSVDVVSNSDDGFSPDASEDVPSDDTNKSRSSTSKLAHVEKQKENEVLKLLTSKKQPEINGDRKRQEMFGSVYQDAFSEWLVNSKKKGKARLSQKKPSLKTVKNTVSDAHQAKRTSDIAIASEDVLDDTQVTREVVCTSLEPRSSASRCESGDKNAPLPRIVLSKLPINVNLQTNKVGVNKAKSDLSSADDPDLEIVYMSPPVVASPRKPVHSSKASNPNSSPTSYCRCPHRRSTVSTDNLTAQVTNLHSQSTYSLEVLDSHGIATSADTVSLPVGNDSITVEDNLASPENVNSATDFAAEQDAPFEPAVQVILSDTSTMEAVSHSPSPVPCSVSKDATVEIEASSAQDLQSPPEESSVSNTNSGETSGSVTLKAAMETPESSEKNTGQPTVLVQKTSEDSYCRCGPWKYPDDLMSRIWQKVQTQCTSN